MVEAVEVVVCGVEVEGGIGVVVEGKIVVEVVEGETVVLEVKTVGGLVGIGPGVLVVLGCQIFRILKATQFFTYSSGSWVESEPTHSAKQSSVNNSLRCASVIGDGGAQHKADNNNKNNRMASTK